MPIPLTLAPPAPAAGRTRTHRPVAVAALVARTEALLRSGVPLSLLMDLAEPDGPRSAALYDLEGTDTDWLDDLPA